jgi:putative copper resistance protein D
MTGRTIRLLTYPLVSSLLVVATELGIYFTPYFATALRVGVVHELMYLHLLLAGCLFVVPVLTREEALPRWCTHPVRAALVFLDGVIDAVPGIVVMTHGTLIAGAWYLHHAPSWAPDTRHDQQLGGGAMISIAELVALPFLLAVLVQWAHTERVQTKALDRRLDAEQVPAVSATGAAQGQGVVAGGGRGADLVRPWWETENGEVAERIRQRRPG